MLIRAIDGLNEIVGRTVAVLALGFATVIVYDVFMRYVLNSPTRWAFDVTKQMFGFYFILLGGYALRHQSHVRVDLLTEHMRPGMRRWVDVAGYLVFFFPFAWIFFRRSWEFAARSWAQGETTYGAVQLPVYPLKAAMCVAAGLLLLQGVCEVLKLLFNRTEAPHGT
ncbi:TRAP transporter small permease subunit [Rhodovulum strictum]|uniref:TRAP transporter small permease protein n=1 Tax=Rhodovulum strictum TaxID=58314 RepID=A0A844BQN3_9RHOB|nr:TRAP transporter small permease subunit [Rhodovulum strictum]MRH22267.1 TRAP transporter small permease subunit [Rhodovulum strictum]